MDDYENIIHENQDNTNAKSPDFFLASLLDGFEGYLRDEYELPEETPYLQGAIKAVLGPFQETPQNGKHWLGRQLCDLVVRLLLQYGTTKRLEDLEMAICVFQTCNDIISPNEPIYATTIRVLQKILHVVFSGTRDVVDIDKGINTIRVIIDTTPPNHSKQPIFLLILENWLIDRFNCAGEMSDLEEAIYVGQDLVNATPPNHPERAIRLSCLAKGFNSRYSSTNDITDLQVAISLACEANDIATPNNLVQARLENGNYLARRYYHYHVQDSDYCPGEVEDIDSAIYMAFEAVEACPTGDWNWSSALTDLANHLSGRCVSTKTLADANSAIIVLQEIISILQVDNPVHTQVLLYLGMCLGNRYGSTGAAADIDEAICAFRGVLRAPSLSDGDRLSAISNLAMSLSDRYDHMGALSDVDECILLTQMAIESIPIDHPERLGMLLSLGTYHSRKYERTGDTIELDETIRIGRLGLDMIPPHRHVFRRKQLTNLAIFITEQYERTGAISDLEESILLTREAMTYPSISPDKRADLLTVLGTRLSTRYHRTNAIEDLNEAISVYQEALEATSLSSHRRAYQLHGFSGILKLRFDRSGEIADLTEAILMSQEALRIIPPNDPRWIKILNCQASSLLKRYHHTGLKEDLENVILMAEYAVNETPQNLPDRAGHLTNLGTLLCQRSAKKAESLIIEALLALPPTNPAIIALAQHGLEIPKRCEDLLDNGHIHTEAEVWADIEKAQKCFIDALYHDAAPVKHRFLAGRAAIRSPRFINYQKAYDVAKLTIDLIPLLTSRSLQNSDKQHMLSIAVGASSYAAAIALHALPAADRPLAAIECLETGRGLIGRTLFEQQEISILKKHSPGIAEYLLAVQHQLDKPALQSATFSGFVDIEAEGNRRCEIEQEYSNLLQTIRSEDGFQRFLLPASESDMLHAAQCGGPIVILNMTRHRCDALIIRQSGLEELALGPHRLFEYLVDKYSKDLESMETLAWLWEDIVCPVLNALGFTEPPSDGIWPHVWWIPTGKLTKFPLHAAGHHLKRNGETTLDRIISSYATSVKAIIHTRNRGNTEAIESLDLVAVAMGQTEGHTPLVHASREVDAIVSILGSKSARCDQPQQYKGNVLSAMRNCQIFHFAGHGEAHPTDPLQSSLLLKDWQDEPLTVSSLLETNLGLNPPFIAYLSACGTGQILKDDSVDESIHLTNAFQLAGFRHVIGTLWSVDDEICVEIATMVYSSFSEGLHDNVVSRGLHDAVRRLRDRWVSMVDERAEQESRAVDGLREGRHARLDDSEELGRPFWIPYVHFGV